MSTDVSVGCPDCGSPAKVTDAVAEFEADRARLKGADALCPSCQTEFEIFYY